jgi:CubicO group peptidase (beta-lactamase class C family)
MSNARWVTNALGRVHDVMSGHIEAGTTPGAVVAVVRGDDLAVEALGAVAPDGAAMRRDTILRIASLTKPITAVATMMLVEQGAMGLDDPVSTWLPELASPRVLRRPDGPIDDTVPTERAITVRDLLSFRVGFGLDLTLPPDAPVLEAERALEINALGPPLPALPPDPDTWMRRFATLPLMHQPGARWLYGTSAQLLGILLGRASGVGLDGFLRARIFEPLGMPDTGFSVPAASLPRFTPELAADPAGWLAVWDAPDGQWSTPPAFADGAAGLVSTIDDYLAFGRAMLRRGAGLLEPATFDALVTDQLTPEQRAAGAPILDAGRGWGLGLSIILDGESPGDVRGRFGWDGGLGSTWYADPANDITAVMMMPRMLDAPESWGVLADFWNAVYASLDA